MQLIRSINRLLCLSLAGIASISFAGQHPAESLVRRTTDEVLTIIRAENRPGNEQILMKKVTETVLPYFDFQRMTALAVGKSWRTASPDQQRRLTEEFKQLLINTYSNALTKTNVKNATVEPLNAPASEQNVTVNSTVVAPEHQKQPIRITYRLSNNGKEWKVYDVLVAGVSIVTTNRNSFNETIGQNGIPGLIKQMQERNAQLRAASP